MVTVRIGCGHTNRTNVVIGMVTIVSLKKGGQISRPTIAQEFIAVRDAFLRIRTDVAADAAIDCCRIGWIFECLTRYSRKFIGTDAMFVIRIERIIVRILWTAFPTHPTVATVEIAFGNIRHLRNTFIGRFEFTRESVEWNIALASFVHILPTGPSIDTKECPRFRVESTIFVRRILTELSRIIGITRYRRTAVAMQQAGTIILNARGTIVTLVGATSIRLQFTIGTTVSIIALAMHRLTRCLPSIGMGHESTKLTSAVLALQMAAIDDTFITEIRRGCMNLNDIFASISGISWWAETGGGFGVTVEYHIMRGYIHIYIDIIYVRIIPRIARPSIQTEFRLILDITSIFQSDNAVLTILSRMVSIARTVILNITKIIETSFPTFAIVLAFAVTTFVRFLAPTAGPSRDARAVRGIRSTRTAILTGTSVGNGIGNRRGETEEE